MNGQDGRRESATRGIIVGRMNRESIDAIEKVE